MSTLWLQILRGEEEEEEEEEDLTEYQSLLREEDNLEDVLSRTTMMRICLKGTCRCVYIVMFTCC